ncbi:LysR family transcriptional regulator [Jannaschia aquimarina]|uniref:YofA_2 protein n=1 Tax=Jannaschia aquimarina TaxID=935700 RepID=A0A0D1EIN7_9RHOB|nr:LysR family transcriptional regulator [Jannaschia aquimarina]KIT17494.1 HTH-type transcriptional regulator YofA [Jannaschia aquimarina]SNS74588.1 transcriptional regulator, LysR family [Jannaschia aquimarina]
MPRNLDLNTLRAFATVASTGGVTRAAGLLNLTQSAVSMQVKRLEEALGVQLFVRTARGVMLTPEGEQTLSYARRLCALNDELLERMRSEAPARQLRLGVPHDIVSGVIPRVLRTFAAEYPHVRVALTASSTNRLKQELAGGEQDLILGTEAAADASGRVIACLPLIWVGAAGGTAWTRRPLPLAFPSTCLFRAAAQAALDTAGIPWVMGVEADSSRSIDAGVSADLAVQTVLDGFFDGRDMEAIPHAGALPDLGEMAITLYRRDAEPDPVRDRLADLLTQEYGALRSRPRLTVAG